MLEANLISDGVNSIDSIFAVVCLTLRIGGTVMLISTRIFLNC